jgi:2,5-diketo-D-gluconate reductase B
MDTMAGSSVAGMPEIGLGTYDLRGALCISAVSDALNTGYRHLDAAQYYENEAEVGKGIRASSVPREEIFVTSKIWPSGFSRILQATEETLARMKLQRLDLMLLHWPANEDANKKAVDGLLEISRKGYATHVGVSNFSIPQVQMAMSRAPIICNQVEYHPYIRQDIMLDHLRKHDLALVAYSPLALGRAARDKVLVGIGARHNKSASQVALRWLIQQDNVHAIPKASSHEKRMENLDVFDFVLTCEEMTEISGLHRV